MTERLGVQGFGEVQPLELLHKLPRSDPELLVRRRARLLDNPRREYAAVCCRRKRELFI
jgi:hypothetical protein